jgi:hypothetical protein
VTQGDVEKSANRLCEVGEVIRDASDVAGDYPRRIGWNSARERDS